MSSGAIIAIGVGVLVVLAVVLIAGAARRRDTGDAIGGLSRETRKRDKSRRPPLRSATTAPPTGAAVEKAAAIERREPSTAVVKSSGGEVAPWVPPDPETLGVTPPSVPQPRRRDLDELQPGRVRRLGASASSGRRARAASAARSPSAS